MQWKMLQRSVLAMWLRTRARLMSTQIGLWDIVTVVSEENAPPLVDDPIDSALGSLVALRDSLGGVSKLRVCSNHLRIPIGMDLPELKVGWMNVLDSPQVVQVYPGLPRTPPRVKNEHELDMRRRRMQYLRGVDHDVKGFRW